MASSPHATHDFNGIIPTPIELRDETPFTEAHHAFISKSRATIQTILEGLDPRKLLIVGPCSIHDWDAALEFASRFKDLSPEVENEFFMVMRAYIEKPRTTIGWKGFLYDPNLDGSYHLSKGLRLTRKLFAQLTEMEIPIASELLEITTSAYYSEFLSWGCIGARTTSSPPHRQLAGSLNFPIGFKNTTDGCIDPAVHGVVCASKPHVFLGLSPKGRMMRVQSSGNPLCHIVLRGGHQKPNYDPKSVLNAVEKCEQAGILEKVLIDCSHDNCEKRPFKQVSAFQSVIDQIAEGSASIAGLMLESHLFGGSQPISSQLRFGVSITDPCLDWQTTEQIIIQAAKTLQAGVLSLR